MGSVSEQQLPPYIGLYLTPGYFLNGTVKRSIGGQEQTSDVNKEDVQTFHFAVRPQIGADLDLTNTITIGINVGYEIGITDETKPNVGEGTHQAAMWKGFTTNFRLMFSL